jgi:hypothetical protein
LKRVSLEIRGSFMSTENDQTVGPTSVRERNACPSCGGPTSPHEETVIRLGHPDRVRLRHLCLDVSCGGSFLAAGSGRAETTGVAE